MLSNASPEQTLYISVSSHDTNFYSSYISYQIKVQTSWEWEILHLISSVTNIMYKCIPTGTLISSQLDQIKTEGMFWLKWRFITMLQNIMSWQTLNLKQRWCDSTSGCIFFYNTMTVEFNTSKANVDSMITINFHTMVKPVYYTTLLQSQ